MNVFLINRITLSECVFMGKSYSIHPEVLNGKVSMRGKGPVASEFPIFLLLGFFFICLGSATLHQVS